MLWDIFCRVIDNHGDVGVCWRLCADLASRGEQVRLWVDEAGALSWMAPHGVRGVSVHSWDDSAASVTPGEVVIEAFGCEIPQAFVHRMAGVAKPPIWLNLEYLSAEAYVERSHRLPSPQTSGPGMGLTKWFFYPGFTTATGGLIREPGLRQAQAAFDARAWLKARGIETQAHERLVSVFCYGHAPVRALAKALSGQPTLLLLTPGIHEPSELPAGIRVHHMPFVAQTDYDRLLWSCDLNFVRGEDSFVRAQWAAKPFVWQIYPQDDGAHAAKLNAFLDRFPKVDGLGSLWSGWNGLADMPAELPPAADWAHACRAWRESLQAQPDLVTQLLQLAARPG